MDASNERHCVRISNIPPHFTIADIRAFFSRCATCDHPFTCVPAVPDLFSLCVLDSFVESGKFEAFHLRPCPRPPSTSATSAPTPVAGRTGLYVPVTRRPPLPPQAVAVFSSASFAASFFHSFHGKKWPAHLPGSTPNTPNTGRCVVDRVVASSSGVFADNKRRVMRGKTSCGGVAMGDEGAIRAHDDSACEGPSFPVVDIPHAPACLPRGNIGTPTSDLLSLVSRCVLPCAALKEMGLQHFAGGGVGRKFKEFNFKWPKSRDASEACGSTRQAPGDNDDDDADGDGLEASWGGGSRNYTRRDRMETRELLHEEGVEDPWDKGDASGLVWYTDAQYWDAQEGDLDDRTSDGLDVVGAGCGGWTRLHDSGGGDGDAGDGERFCDDSAAAERAFEHFVAQGLPGALLSKWGYKADASSGRLPVLNANRTRTGLGWQGRGDVNVPLRRFHEEMEGEDLVGSYAAAVGAGQRLIGTVFDKVPVTDVAKRR
jgi:hypothetical protein